MTLGIARSHIVEKGVTDWENGRTDQEGPQKKIEELTVKSFVQTHADHCASASSLS